MIKHLIGCGISIVALLCGSSHKSLAQHTIPSVEVKSLNGKAIDISTVQNDGKPMIVFAWEVTCLPCIAEFNAIAPHFEDWKKETGLKIVAVSVDDSRSSPRVSPLVRTKGWPYEFYLDTNQAFKRAMGVTYCPYAFLLNGAGEVVWQKGAYSPGDETIIYELAQKVAKGEKID